MANEPFLARTEEQDKFKQTLDLLMLPNHSGSGSAFVYLLYGEGGMGKTRLTQRLREIAETWQPYEGKFNVLFIDWEVERDSHPDLQVGHDNIRPETILKVIHDAFAQNGWGKHFQKYRDVINVLQTAETKINKELQSKPENELYAKLRRLGSKPLAALIRKHIPLVEELIPQDSLEESLQVAAELSAELTAQARNLVQDKLTPKEYEVYAEPHKQLARALGQSIATLTRTKPFVVFSDTYEVVDRPECDYTLRQVIEESKANVVWVLAGRANLADSVRQDDKYFRGYKNEFPDEKIYSKALSEFSLQDIQDYFLNVVPERQLTEKEAKQIAQFTLGIPFAVSEGAAMWEQGASLEDIVAPIPPQTRRSNYTPHQKVVNAMSERFLKHCIRDAHDLRAIYALALVRQPSHDLLCTMLEAESLSRELQLLRERYSFILVDEMRLEEKLSTFLREYLLAEVRRKDPPIPELLSRAVDFLQKQLAQWTSDMSTAEERLDSGRASEIISDLVHHKFWVDEDEGWCFLIPHFVEGLRYDPAWATSLLEIVNTFRPTLSREGIRRLRILLIGSGIGWLGRDAGTNGRKLMLDEIEKVAKRGWLKGEGENERTAILQYERGDMMYGEGKYKEALQRYLMAERLITENMRQLRVDLADSFSDLGFQLVWEHDNAIASAEGRAAFEHAVGLNAGDAHSHYGLGVMGTMFNERNVAIAEYKLAIELDPKFSGPHNGLGNVYYLQDKYEDTIAEYKLAIELDPKDAYPHSNVAEIYIRQARLEDATAELAEATRLGGETYSRLFNIGLIYAIGDQIDKANGFWQKALTLCKEHDLQDKLSYAFLKLLTGDAANGLSYMMEVIKESRPGVGLLTNLLNDVQAVAQCPSPPSGTTEMVMLLLAAITEQLT